MATLSRPQFWTVIRAPTVPSRRTNRAPEPPESDPTLAGSCSFSHPFPEQRQKILSVPGSCFPGFGFAERAEVILSTAPSNLRHQQPAGGVQGRRKSDLRIANRPKRARRVCHPERIRNWHRICIIRTTVSTGPCPKATAMFVQEMLMLLGGLLVVVMSLSACTARRSANPFSAY